MKTLICSKFTAISLCTGLLFAASACGRPLNDRPTTTTIDALDLQDGTSTDAASLVGAAAYLPLQVGNSWTLKGSSESAAAVTLKVEYSADEMGLVSGLAEESVWLGFGTKKPSILYVWNAEGNEWSPLAKFGRGNGTTWTTKLNEGGCGTFTARVRTRKGSVETLAGTFSNSFAVDYTLKPKPNVRCAAPSLTSLTFAEGVGFVAKGRDQERVSLASASINGQAVPSALSVSLEQLLADPKAYHQQRIVVVAEPRTRGAACTKRACADGNPCCNSCHAKFVFGSDETGVVALTQKEEAVGCSGNECTWQAQCQVFNGFENGRYALTGVFTDSDGYLSLDLETFTAADCRRTGCGGEVCANRDVFTTCIVKPEQTCYQEFDAACTAQADGHCGFTVTPDIAACLNRRY